MSIVAIGRRGKITESNPIEQTPISTSSSTTLLALTNGRTKIVCGNPKNDETNVPPNATPALTPPIRVRATQSIEKSTPSVHWSTCRHNQSGVQEIGGAGSCELLVCRIEFHAVSPSERQRKLSRSSRSGVRVEKIRARGTMLISKRSSAPIPWYSSADESSKSGSCNEVGGGGGIGEPCFDMLSDSSRCWCCWDGVGGRWEGQQHLIIHASTVITPYHDKSSESTETKQNNSVAA